MAWVAVDKDGEEWVYSQNPAKGEIYWYSFDDKVELPSGSIKKLIGRNLSWDDDPVELK